MPPLATYLAHPFARNIATFVKLFCVYHVFGAYVGYPQQSDGPSMLPALGVRGEWLWVSTWHGRGRGVRVGDLVSVRHPLVPGEGVSKRVLGMPGDFVLRDTPEGGGDAMIQVHRRLEVTPRNVALTRGAGSGGPLLAGGRQRALVARLEGLRARPAGLDPGQGNGESLAPVPDEMDGEYPEGPARIDTLGIAQRR